MILNYEQDQKIIELFLHSKTQTEIAHELNCTREWIRQRLERNGFTGRNYRWIPEQEKLLSALSKANSLSHAAQLLNLTDLQLQTAIKHHSASEALTSAKNRWKTQKRDERNLSRKRPLINQIRELALKLGHTPRQDELQSGGIPHMKLVRIFGSLTESMIASGLIPNPHGSTSSLPLDFSDIAEPTLDFDEAQQRANLLRQVLENIPEPAGTENPKRVTVTTSAYYRDPKVAAWVLQFANGIC